MFVSGLLNKYPPEMLADTPIQKLTGVPSLEALISISVKHQVFPTDVLPPELLVRIEPPTVAMGQAIEKLSELNTSEAKRAELYFYWGTASNFPHSRPLKSDTCRIPFVYFPPKLS